jgi:hypothetical protein
MEACNRLHGESCVPQLIPQRLPEDVPLWLIDTYKQCIVPGLSAHRYLALSYMWPESRTYLKPAAPPPRTLLLDNASIVDFQRPGFLGIAATQQRIPHVIRYAVAFTCALGERYLWVDRLCIVQDDSGDQGTLSQVKRMDRIYDGAYLTIIAAASDEVYKKGLCFDWPTFATADRCRWRQASETEDRPLTTSRRRLNMEEIVDIISIRYDMLSKSRWATRGWTYQEQILCKRAVVFLDGGYFWDCHCCVWDIVDLVPGQEYEGIAWRAGMGQRLITQRWPDFALYRDLIGPYNGRTFSYPQDALLGISGVLNTLEKSFTGGFVHGLPKLFLDQALLWQPFGTAERRIDRNEDEIVHSSLPSWSWCGWQCFVDPWSLRSSLSYVKGKIYPGRGRDWRTRNLVEWHHATGDQIEKPILEPRWLDQLVDVGQYKPDALPDGWAHHEEIKDELQHDVVSVGSAFTHSKENHILFSHPIPIGNASSQEIQLSTSTYLTCHTTTASLLPATVLVQASKSSYCTFAPSKISAFEEQIFKNGPPQGQNCPVLVLQQPNGAFAGLLRLMSQKPVDQNTALELIAISSGSAPTWELRQSFEWRIFESGDDRYDNDNHGVTWHYAPAWLSQKGKSALVCDIAMAFSKDMIIREELDRGLQATLAKIEQRCDAQRRKIAEELARKEHDLVLSAESWLAVRNDVLGFGDKARLGHYMGPSRAHTLWPTSSRNLDVPVCEFYNVLWIERQDGVAYRRACGWVPKAIWEAHLTGPIEVKLG